MIPVECPSMRSIARWVLPVLVGPSTAVTPAPRARASRLVGDENEMAIAVLSGCELPSSRRLADVLGAVGRALRSLRERCEAALQPAALLLGGFRSRWPTVAPGPRSALAV